MKVAVTGANGHIGANLCRSLLKKGYSVKTLSYKDTRAIAGLNVENITGNVLEVESLKDLISDVDVVFHLAVIISIQGDSGGRMHKVNVDGTRNIINVCKNFGNKRLIHYSSIHAFEQHPLDKLLDETRPLVGDKAFKYDKSKVASEKLVLEAARNGLDAVILSPTAVLGPYDFKPSLMGYVLLNLYNRKFPALIPGGYNWVDARDVAEGSISAIEKAERGEKYLLGGNYHGIQELGNLVEKITGKKPPKLISPLWLAHVGVPFSTIYNKLANKPSLFTHESLQILKNSNKHISNEKAKKVLGFSPRPLEETIKDSITWFKNNNYIK